MVAPRLGKEAKQTVAIADAGRALAESDRDSGGRAEETIRDVDLNEAMDLV